MQLEKYTAWGIKSCSHVKYKKNICVSVKLSVLLYFFNILAWMVSIVTEFRS